MLKSDCFPFSLRTSFQLHSSQLFMATTHSPQSQSFLLRRKTTTNAMQRRRAASRAAAAGRGRVDERAHDRHHSARHRAPHAAGGRLEHPAALCAARWRAHRRESQGAQRRAARAPARALCAHAATRGHGVHVRALM